MIKDFYLDIGHIEVLISAHWYTLRGVAGLDTFNVEASPLHVKKSLLSCDVTTARRKFILINISSSR